jgi:hypothetical protein
MMCLWVSYKNKILKKVTEEMSRTRSWIRTRIRTKMSRIPNTGTSVADLNPDPPDSRVFGFPGSGSGPIT